MVALLSHTLAQTHSIQGIMRFTITPPHPRTRLYSSLHLRSNLFANLLTIIIYICNKKYFSCKLASAKSLKPFAALSFIHSFPGFGTACISASFRAHGELLIERTRPCSLSQRPPAQLLRQSWGGSAAAPSAKADKKF